MLLYITTGEGRDREVRPLHTIPDTVNELYYLAMREHVRPAVVQYWLTDRWARDPDWRFDRQVIRVALFLGERLGVERGRPVAVLGPLGVTWPLVDFAVQGLNGVPIGIDHRLDDRRVVEALRDAKAAVVFATDDDSAARAARLRGDVDSLRFVVQPSGADEGADGVVGMNFVWSRGEVLDTPERAQRWRGGAREAGAADVAFVHYARGTDGTAERQDVTHREAMDFVRDRVARAPGKEGDVAYFATRTMTSRARLCLYQCVGDGYAMVTMPHPDGDAAMVDLGPTRLVAPSALLERLAEELAALSGVGRARRIRERVQQTLGERMRWIEPAEPLSASHEQVLLEAGLPLPFLAAGAKASP